MALCGCGTEVWLYFGNFGTCRTGRGEAACRRRRRRPCGARAGTATTATAPLAPPPPSRTTHDPCPPLRFYWAPFPPRKSRLMPPAWQRPPLRSQPRRCRSAACVRRYRPPSAPAAGWPKSGACCVASHARSVGSKHALTFAARRRCRRPVPSSGPPWLYDQPRRPPPCLPPGRPRRDAPHTLFFGRISASLPWPRWELPPRTRRQSRWRQRQRAPAQTARAEQRRPSPDPSPPLQSALPRGPPPFASGGRRGTDAGSTKISRARPPHSSVPTRSQYKLARRRRFPVAVHDSDCTPPHPPTAKDPSGASRRSPP